MVTLFTRATPGTPASIMINGLFTTLVYTLTLPLWFDLVIGFCIVKFVEYANSVLYG